MRFPIPALAGHKLREQATWKKSVKVNMGNNSPVSVDNML